MKGKRAQAAMEFLMTYGWAILVVLAAVGILAYLGVFSMEQDVAAICKLRPTGQKLDCQTDPFIDGNNGRVEFTVLNNHAYEAQGINTPSLPDACSGGNLQTANLTQGETAVFNVTGCTFNSGERYDLVFSLQYVDDNGQSHSTSAKISDTAS